MPAETNLTPPQRMAVAYARREWQQGLSILLELDNRLLAIAAKGPEPVLKQLRLAWWREQLEKGDAAPRGEPLLARIAANHELPELVASLQKLVEAFEHVVAADGDRNSPALAQAIALRGTAVFGSYACWVRAPVDAENVRLAGEQWARRSFGLSVADKAALLPAAFKPLNLLSLACALDGDANLAERLLKYLRMNWHALTGV